MIFGLYTKKDMEELKNDYELKLINKDAVIHSKDESNDFLRMHNSDLVTEIRVLKKIIESHRKTFGKINKDRARFLNSKSVRIKKKYMKKINKKLEA